MFSVGRSISRGSISPAFMVQILAGFSRARKSAKSFSMLNLTVLQDLTGSRPAFFCAQVWGNTRLNAICKALPSKRTKRNTCHSCF